ncbi:hypothetical protein MMC26_006559 [Xylographa opegraphella]|nr:hypothetical protein [Xylographa opegraphella]
MPTATVGRWKRYYSGRGIIVEPEQKLGRPCQEILQAEEQAGRSRPNLQINTTRSKGVSESPSDLLTAALERGGYRSAIPGKYENKLDHTHTPPLSSNWQSSSTLSRRNQKYSSKDAENPPVHCTKAPHLTLQLILTRYLDLLHYPNYVQDSDDEVVINLRDASDEVILQVFNDTTIAYLRIKGYDPNDVQVWAWILTAKTSLEVALRIFAVSSQSNELSTYTASHIPTFVFLFVLRRTQMTTQALRLLVVHAWQRLGKTESSREVLAIRDLIEQRVPQSQRYKRCFKGPVENANLYQKMSETTIVIIVIRLLRHARKLWPAAFTSISTMITTQIHPTRGGQSLHEPLTLNEITSARLSFLYNKVLHLLSLPSSQHPYRAIPYHQRAQFNIISRMNDFEPALTINKEGYRAVVRVQLAHRRTIQEREWARMKAKSWPPWKEEKLGIDADVGIESGISRANESLSRFSEAGYGPQSWEGAAKVLSGWDSDRSPTIQTRTIPSRLTGQNRARGRNVSRKDAELESHIWAARIRATRTLHESWACFLAYQDQKAAPSQAVYYAMLEKLIFDVKRRRKEAKMKATLSSCTIVDRITAERSGEGKEVNDLPTDPRDGIYIRTLPPSVDDFFAMMVSTRIQPSGRCLAFLLSHAESLSEGFKYLRSSNLSPIVINTLLECKEAAVSLKRGILKQIPDLIFASYIRLLSRFGSVDFGHVVDMSKGYVTSIEQSAHSMSPLMQAFRLVYACKPSYRPPWYSLLSALTRSKVRLRLDDPAENIYGERIVTWGAMLRVVGQMQAAGIDLDFEGFHKICIGFEKAFVAAERILAEPRRQIRMTKGNSAVSHISSKGALKAWNCSRREAEEVLYHGSHTLKAMFKRLALSHLGDENLGKGTAERLRSKPELDNPINPSILLPRLLEVPSPAELHALIRALGLSRDYNGLHALILWMVHFAPELKAVADELRNGPELMRRCLIAARAFMDGSWFKLVAANEEQNKVVRGYAAEGDIDRVCMLIGQMEGWGGWPTDEEVETYCRGSKSFKRKDSIIAT